jgi:hypothetical protein
MERLKTWPGTARANRRRARPRRPALALMQLEQRLTPSVAPGLLNVPDLSWWQSAPDLSRGYVETHTLTRSFALTLTLDESGSAASGTYTLDILGETHQQDQVSGAGDYVSSSGTLTADATYHSVISGRHTPTGDVVDSQTYSESGTATEIHAVRTGPIPENDDRRVYDYDGNETVQWDLSWSAVVAGGALSFTSFSNVHSDDVTWHFHVTSGPWFVDLPGRPRGGRRGPQGPRGRREGTRTGAAARGRTEAGGARLTSPVVTGDGSPGACRGGPFQEQPKGVAP